MQPWLQAISNCHSQPTFRCLFQVCHCLFNMYYRALAKPVDTLLYHVQTIETIYKSIDFIRLSSYILCGANSNIHHTEGPFNHRLQSCRRLHNFGLLLLNNLICCIIFINVRTLPTLFLFNFHSPFIMFSLTFFNSLDARLIFDITFRRVKSFYTLITIVRSLVIFLTLAVTLLTSLGLLRRKAKLFAYSHNGYNIQSSRPIFDGFVIYPCRARTIESPFKEQHYRSLYELHVPKLLMLYTIY